MIVHGCITRKQFWFWFWRMSQPDNQYLRESICDSLPGVYIPSHSVPASKPCLCNLQLMQIVHVHDTCMLWTRPRGYKTFFVLNSAVRELFSAVKYEMPTNIDKHRQFQSQIIWTRKQLYLSHGGESRDLNDRVHGISCRYSDKTGKQTYLTFLNTQPIFIKQSANIS